MCDRVDDVIDVYVGHGHAEWKRQRRLGETRRMWKVIRADAELAAIPPVQVNRAVVDTRTDPELVELALKLISCQSGLAWVDEDRVQMSCVASLRRRGSRQLDREEANAASYRRQIHSRRSRLLSTRAN